MSNKIFTKRVTTKGDLYANFVFENDASVKQWVADELPELKQKYGNITFVVTTLPGFTVGDTCRVYGEGNDEFKIVGLRQYSDHRFAFILDSGWTEEVAKCY